MPLLNQTTLEFPNSNVVVPPKSLFLPVSSVRDHRVSPALSLSVTGTLLSPVAEAPQHSISQDTNVPPTCFSHQRLFTDDEDEVVTCTPDEEEEAENSSTKSLTREVTCSRDSLFLASVSSSSPHSEANVSDDEATTMATEAVPAEGMKLDHMSTLLQEGASELACVLRRGENGGVFGFTISPGPISYVSKVDKDSSADKAGVCNNDLLVKINGTPVDKMTPKDIHHLIEGLREINAVFLRPACAKSKSEQDLSASSHTSAVKSTSEPPRTTATHRLASSSESENESSSVRKSSDKAGVSQRESVGAGGEVLKRTNSHTSTAAGLQAMRTGSNGEIMRPKSFVSPITSPASTPTSGAKGLTKKRLNFLTFGGGQSESAAVPSSSPKTTRTLDMGVARLGPSKHADDTESDLSISGREGIPSMIPGFRSSSSSEGENLDDNEAMPFKLRTKRTIRKLMETFTSLNKVLQQASRIACVFHFIFTYNRDPVPLFFKILLDDYREKSEHVHTTKQLACKACQLYSTFLHPKAPLQLAILDEKPFSEPITTAWVTQHLDELDRAVSACVQEDLDSMCDRLIAQGMYSKIIPFRVVEDEIRCKDEDLLEFDKKLRTFYVNFVEKSTPATLNSSTSSANSNSVDVQSQAKAWCLAEVGRYFSETCSSLVYPAGDSKSLGGQTLPAKHLLSSSRSCDNLNSNFFWQLGDAVGSHKPVRKPTLIRISKSRKQQIRGHSFTFVLLESASKCSECEELFWGPDVARCSMCQNCGIKVHTHCQTEALKKCPKKRSSKTLSETSSPSVGGVPVRVISKTYIRLNGKELEILPEDELVTLVQHVTVHDSSVVENSGLSDRKESLRGNADCNSVANENSQSDFSGVVVEADARSNGHRTSSAGTESRPGPSGGSVSASSSFGATDRAPSLETNSAVLGRKSLDYSNEKDLSTYFPKEDEYLTVEESYQWSKYSASFPQQEQLSDASLKRLHVLAECQYYVQYIVKQLKIVDLFGTVVWNKFVKVEGLQVLQQNLGFDCIQPLVDIYIELDKIIAKHITPESYRPFGNAFWEWLCKHEVLLFQCTNRICGCVRNAAVWQEVEKLQQQAQPNTGLTELFEEVSYQRFNMKSRVENIYRVLVIRFPFLLNHAREMFVAVDAQNELESWEKIYTWYRRVCSYQNNVLQPLLSAISVGRVANGASLAEKNDPTSHPLMTHFPRQIFDELLFEWQPVEVAGLTSTVLASTSRNKDTNLPSGADIASTRESRQALALLYQSRLVLLQRSDGGSTGERFLLKSFKTKTGASGGQSSNSSPVFSLSQCHVTLQGAHMHLIVLDGATASRRIEMVFLSPDICNEWKQYVHRCGGSPSCPPSRSSSHASSTSLHRPTSALSTGVDCSPGSHATPLAHQPDLRGLFHQLFDNIDRDIGPLRENALRILLGPAAAKLLKEQQQLSNPSSQFNSGSTTSLASSPHPILKTRSQTTMSSSGSASTAPPSSAHPPMLTSASLPTGSPSLKDDATPEVPRLQLSLDEEEDPLRLLQRALDESKRANNSLYERLEAYICGLDGTPRATLRQVLDMGVLSARGGTSKFGNSTELASSLSREDVLLACLDRNAMLTTALQEWMQPMLVSRGNDGMLSRETDNMGDYLDMLEQNAADILHLVRHLKQTSHTMEHSSTYIETSALTASSQSCKESLVTWKCSNNADDSLLHSLVQEYVSQVISTSLETVCREQSAPPRTKPL